MEPNGSGFKIENVYSKEKTQHKKLKCKSSIQCLLMLRSWFTKDWKTLEIPTSFFWRTIMHWTLMLPQVFKHNIVWRYQNSRAKATLHRPCWQAPMLLPIMLSSRRKVLRSSEPIFPYDISGLGILSSRQDPLCWTCMGIPFCRKRSSPGFDTTVHGLWRPISYLLWGSVDQSVLGPTPTLLTPTWPEFSKRGTSTSNGNTTSIPYTKENRVAPVDVCSKVQ